MVAWALKQRYPKRIPLIPFERFRAWWFIVVGLVISYKLGSTAGLGSLPRLVSFTFLSLFAMTQFMNHLKHQPSIRVKFFCYLTCLCQYYWVFIEWYGFFTVFIPVFAFLYLPICTDMVKGSSSKLMETSTIHWVLMCTVFCLSHAAYLLILPRGAGLLFFVVLLTELADGARMLLARTPSNHIWSPILSCLTAVLVSMIVAPVFTPLSTEHSLLAGVVLGIAGTIGHKHVAVISKELGIPKGGPLERIESLAYTAPIFLHAYRYLDYPL